MSRFKECSYREHEWEIYSEEQTFGHIKWRIGWRNKVSLLEQAIDEEFPMHNESSRRVKRALLPYLNMKANNPQGSDGGNSLPGHKLNPTPYEEACEGPKWMKNWIRIKVEREAWVPKQNMHKSQGPNIKLRLKNLMCKSFSTNSSHVLLQFHFLSLLVLNNWGVRNVTIRKMHYTNYEAIFTSLASIFYR